MVDEIIGRSSSLIIRTAGAERLQRLPDLTLPTGTFDSVEACEHRLDGLVDFRQMHDASPSHPREHKVHKSRLAHVRLPLGGSRLCDSPLVRMKNLGVRPGLWYPRSLSGYVARRFLTLAQPVRTERGP